MPCSLLLLLPEDNKSRKQPGHKGRNTTKGPGQNTHIQLLHPVTPFTAVLVGINNYNGFQQLLQRFLVQGVSMFVFFLRVLHGVNISINFASATVWMRMVTLGIHYLSQHGSRMQTIRVQTAPLHACLNISRNDGIPDYRHPLITITVLTTQDGQNVSDKGRPINRTTFWATLSWWGVLMIVTIVTAKLNYTSIADISGSWFVCFFPVNTQPGFTPQHPRP